MLVNFYILTWLATCLTCCFSFIDVGTLAGVAGAVVVSVSFGAYNMIKSTMYETCDNKWINFNFHGLKRDLDNDLFGQHLVTPAVLRMIQSHVHEENPQKALALSFHGYTGSGKNHVAKMIINNLYKEKGASQFVHLYIGTQHFPHKNKVDDYRLWIQSEIKQYTKRCGRSVFIFDEIEKIPEGVLGVLTPYLDFHDNIDGVDFRKNIFLFLSNSGGNAITKVALNFWLDGKSREDITMKDIESLVSQGAFNERGGFKGSSVISRNLIDLYVPFLPLEKCHVRQCIEREMESKYRHAEENVILKVLNDLTFEPPELDIYADSGCKRVSSKIKLHM